MRTIGVDVSKATLDVALRDGTGSLVKEDRVKNSTAGLRSLLRKWSKQGLCDTTALVYLEPTGHYSHGVVKTLLDLGHPTWMAHATDIRLSIGMQRGKSDKVDARRIAEYAHRFQDKARLPGTWAGVLVLGSYPSSAHSPLMVARQGAAFAFPGAQGGRGTSSFGPAWNSAPLPLFHPSMAATVTGCAGWRSGSASRP